jgi:hypothetical protein
MFGLSLRAYHAKVARLSESGTERGRSLWEALLEFVRDEGPVSRLTVLERFSGDEETVVRGVWPEIFGSGRSTFTAWRSPTRASTAFS